MRVLDDACAGLYSAIRDSCEECRSDLISLSGGLDSTIIACMQGGHNPKAVAVIAADFVSSDLTYCQLAAKEARLDLSICSASTPEILEGVGETVRILGNFNDIEIRNSVVMYLAIKWAKEHGYGSITTGDGADELFGGYDFMVNMDPGMLKGELERVRQVMHFPAQKIGDALGVRVASPFLEKEVADLAARIPADMMVREEGGKRHGKWPLRKAFEGVIPRQIAWRPKSPMQDGAGTSGLTGLFESLIQEEAYVEKKLTIQDSDGVVIRSRESMHYYEIYKKHFGAPAGGRGAGSCPYCGHDAGGSKFCRMCGAFPI